MEPDFSGWATKAGLKCSDGRTITSEAFKHQDKMTVPLVWQHGHNNPENVLGHVVLEHRDQGVYGYAYFNGTPSAQNAKTLVQHKDITALSIYANQLVEKSKTVLHGMIREVSLVLSGANPGALIENVAIQHSGGEVETLDDEAVIFTGLELEHEDKPGDAPEPDDQKSEADETPADEVQEVKDGEEDGDETAQEVYDSLSPEQKDVVHFMIGKALESAGAQHSDEDENDLEHKEGNEDMSRNVFDQTDNKDEKKTLSHSDVAEIMSSLPRTGSLKHAVEEYALKHGIDNIEVLFPEARALPGTPEFNSRRMEWVNGVLNGVRKNPFTRIKNLTADITMDEARAKGYIKGNMKKEEFFSVSKRVTTPTTIYKKQKLDRDDILDITDFDVVVWMKGEMRIMLDEELARAILIGDGRAVDDEDKVKDPQGAAEGAGIRSIANDHELYVTPISVTAEPITPANAESIIDLVLENMRFYKGSGSPTFYTTLPVITSMLLVKDTLQRRKYSTKADLATAMGVGDIVAVEAMEDEVYGNLVGVIVNLSDYTVGADRGGEVSLFDFFDIDYNQQKYLLETRVSGALTKLKSALVLRAHGVSDTALAAPVEPTEANNVVTIPTVANVSYINLDTGATLTPGAQPALTDANDVLRVQAVPASGHYFETGDVTWTFVYSS